MHLSNEQQPFGGRINIHITPAENTVPILSLLW